MHQTTDGNFDDCYKGMKSVCLVDLPGIYSLSPYTAEEIVTRDFIIRENPDALINIVDATNIERSLYLSLQLMELEVPMVIALNMMDEVRSSGNQIDVGKLSEYLGVPVIPISAGKNEGIDRLTMILEEFRQGKRCLSGKNFYSGPVQRTLLTISQIAEQKAKRAGLPLRYAAAKIMEGDAPVQEELALSGDDKQVIAHILAEMEYETGTDRQAALADMRYHAIEKLCAGVVARHRETRGQVRSERIDRLMTHKYLGIPIFLCIMFLIFVLTFSVIGAPLQNGMAALISMGSGALAGMLAEIGADEWLISLLVDGICAGIGSVLSFLPLIVLLFFFLSLLEDSGYMARVAFVMDKLLRKIGLSGRSFVPMLLGFGCSVPAIMATRTLSSERDRKMTIILTPFMSCSAKLPIYGMITAAFFPSRRFRWDNVTGIGSFFSEFFSANQGAVVMLSLYIIGILIAVLSGLLLHRTVFRGQSVPFVMELPAYRIPAAKSVLLHLWEKAEDFLKRAFTIIFVASIILWLLQGFDTALRPVTDSTDSILAAVGMKIAPVFAPLGFHDWMVSTALVTGIIAKEMVVSTLSVLTGVTADGQLIEALHGIFSSLSAFSFLVFTVLYMPCVAAFAATKREMGSWHGAFGAMIYQTGIAYVTAMLIFQIGSRLI